MTSKPIVRYAGMKISLAVMSLEPDPRSATAFQLSNTWNSLRGTSAKRRPGGPSTGSPTIAQAAACEPLE